MEILSLLWRKIQQIKQHFIVVYGLKNGANGRKRENEGGRFYEN